MIDAPTFLLLFFCQFLLILVPGVVCSLWLQKRGIIKNIYVIPVAIAIYTLVGYVAFYTYILNKQLGVGLSYALVLVTLLGIIYAISKGSWRKCLSADVAIPLSILFLISLFYTLTVFSCRQTTSIEPLNQQCHLHSITFDNAIPHIFANNIYEGMPKALIGDWRGSDRPPLLTGSTLLQSPLTLSNSKRVVSYEILAVILQCSWVPIVWALGRQLKLKIKANLFVTMLCAFSGFFFFNSVFTWPKLLAGSLVTLAFLLIFFERPSKIRWSIAAISAALGFLAHSSVIFTLIPIGLFVILIRRHNPGWKILLMGGTTFVILCMPWVLYQKLYDPPGDRLLKWHVGGSENIDSRSVIQATSDSYRKANPKTIVSNKVGNLTTPLGRIPPEGSLYTDNFLGKLRDAEFRYMLFGLGIGNLGWLLLLKRDYYAKLKKTVDLKRLWFMLCVSAISLVLWALMLFGPNITVIHAGSYTNMILMMTTLFSVLSIIKVSILKLLAIIQASYFLIVWVISVWMDGTIHSSMVLLSLVSFVCLLIIIKWFAGHYTEDSPIL